MFFSRSPRFPVQFTAVYDDGERYLTAPVTNLSGSGLFIETSAPAVEGASVHIVPLLPPSRGLPELQGVVVRVQNGQAELGRAQPAGMGIKFVALGDGDAEQLRAYCENLKGEYVHAKHDAAPSKAKDKPSKVETPEPVVGYRGLSLKSEPAVDDKAVEAQAAAAAEPATVVDTEADTRVSAKGDAPADAASDDAAAVPVEAAPSHAEARTTESVSAEDEMPMLADDDAELLETGEAKRLETAPAAEPILLDKTKTEPVLLDKRKAAASAEEELDATEPDTPRPEVTAKTAEVDVSEPPAVEDTPELETEKIDRTLTASPAWEVPTDQPYAHLVDDELAAVVPSRGQGAVIALGLLNLLAIGGAIAYGAYRLDGVEQQQSTTDVRLTTMGQDVGFVSERTKTLQRGLDRQTEVLADLSDVVLKPPALTQSIAATPAGAPGRYIVQTSAQIANPNVDEGEVVFVTRRVLIGDLGAVPVALGKAQNVNGANDKGAVVWRVLEQEQHLSDGEKLKAFTSLTKQERSELMKGAKVGDVVGALAAGGSRDDERQLLLDLPQGGLLGVETEVGVMIDDKAITLKQVETTGIPAVVAPTGR